MSSSSMNFKAGIRDMKYKAALLFSITLPLLTPVAAPVVTAQELSPMGAIIAGNAEGTIPAWTGGLEQAPLEASRVSDPYPNDTVLYMVTAQNAADYEVVLTAGQKALLEKYPDSYSLPVYQSRRSASYPEFVYAALKKNRQSAELVTEGDKSGVRSSRISSPFPEPKNGLEAIWNHLMRWRGILLERETSWVPVTARGNYRPILLREELAFPYASPAYDIPDAEGEVSEYRRAMVAVKQKFVSPGRLSSTGSLVYETYDYTNYDRIRWLYPAEARRVIRLPRAPMDQPLPASNGIVRMDDIDMFRGSTEMFDWELVGRRELLVPYNAYRLKRGDLGFKDLIARHHLNQEHTRYELHRVWEVKATAKESSRSHFGQRIFYLDEDTWQVVVSEKYDHDGELVMHSEAHTVNFYNVPVTFTGVITHYVLEDGRFAVTDINNMLAPYKWHDTINPINFSPNALLDYLR